MRRLIMYAVDANIADRTLAFARRKNCSPKIIARYEAQAEAANAALDAAIIQSQREARAARYIHPYIRIQSRKRRK